MSSAQKKVHDALVDFTSKIDFAKGFSSFHMQWPITMPFASLDDGELSVSPKFDTKVKTEHGENIFTWSLGVSREKSSIWMGILSKKLPFPTPIIFRLALRNGNEAPFFNESLYGVYDLNIPPMKIRFGHKVSLEQANSFVSDNLILHCWMDIPNDNRQSFSKERCAGDCSNSENFHSQGQIDFSTDLSKLFKNVVGDDEKSKLLSDVTLVVSERRFYCHRVILANRSPVFETLFNNKNGWKECRNESLMEIKDIDASIMEKVLRYVYTGSIFPKDDAAEKKLECDELLGIIHAAEKYLLSKLKNFCMIHLIVFSKKDEERVDQFLIADRYDMPRLKAVSMAALSSNFEGIKCEEKIPYDLLMELVSAMAKRQIETTEICVKGYDDDLDENYNN